MKRREKRVSLDVWKISRHLVSSSPESIRATLEGWHRNRDIARLASCTKLLCFQDASPEDVRSIEILLQVEALFKKNRDLDCGVDTKAVSIRDFLEGERRCSLINQKFNQGWGSRCFTLRENQENLSFVWHMRNQIASMMGPFELFLRDLPHLTKLTSGATAKLPRKYTSPYRKIRSGVTCTRGALPYVRTLLRYHGLRHDRVRVGQLNRITTVPKSWKTDRTIACEADGNIPLQLAFDKYVKRRLVRAGQDLSDQTRNQRDAHEGSINGSLATIDFSMASDTISQSVIHLLFPEEWYNYLCDVRAPAGLLPDGSIVSYEKMSSMGNGTTFVLETLVFYAMAKAVGSVRTNVYGDDVTIESELVNKFSALSNFLGFTVNKDKSHYQGLYRESCGRHYFNGQEVTPFYLRSLNSRPANFCLVLNSLSERGYLSISEYLINWWNSNWGRLPPIVAYSEDPTDGIHVSETFARDHGTLTECWQEGDGPIIYNDGSVLHQRRLTPRGVVKVADRQLLTYWLWLYRSDSRKSIDHEDVVLPATLYTSSYACATGATRVRLMTWHRPGGELVPHRTVLNEEAIHQLNK